MTAIIQIPFLKIALFMLLLSIVFYYINDSKYSTFKDEIDKVSEKYNLLKENNDVLLNDYKKLLEQLNNKTKTYILQDLKYDTLENNKFMDNFNNELANQEEKEKFIKIYLSDYIQILYTGKLAINSEYIIKRKPLILTINDKIAHLNGFIKLTFNVNNKNMFSNNKDGYIHITNSHKQYIYELITLPIKMENNEPYIISVSQIKHQFQTFIIYNNKLFVMYGYQSNYNIKKILKNEYRIKIPNGKCNTDTYLLGMYKTYYNNNGLMYIQQVISENQQCNYNVYLNIDTHFQI